MDLINILPFYTIIIKIKEQIEGINDANENIDNE
jgi:hypothetical protein